MEPGESWTDFNQRVNEALPLVHAKKQKVSLEKTKPKNKNQPESDLSDEETNTRHKKRDRSPDPWAHLEKKRPKFGEVVDAPPQLTVPKRILSSVPKNAGSMARRFMLEQERERVVKQYRELVEKKQATKE